MIEINHKHRSKDFNYCVLVDPPVYLQPFSDSTTFVQRFTRSTYCASKPQSPNLDFSYSSHSYTSLFVEITVTTHAYCFIILT